MMGAGDERYRVAKSRLIVTKPSGEVVMRDVLLSYDRELNTYEVVFVGESVLKGYSFAILDRECQRVKESGDPVATLPRFT
jgi:hypothetical protein